jgi:hypothetical protein
MAESVPRIRRKPIPDSALLVIRGDVLDEQVLRSDAQRFSRRFQGWERFGVSGFLAASEAEITQLFETRLDRYATVIVYRRADLEALGVEVVATFRVPHVTIAHRELDALVMVILTCDHGSLDNPYFI